MWIMYPQKIRRRNRRMMRILLTGANGFIGRNLAENLRLDHEVETPDREALDLTDARAVESYLGRHCFDVVIHAANVNNTRTEGVAAYEILDGNLRMFLNLERCSTLYGRMYYFGSGAEYDMRFYTPSMREEYFGSHIPADAYGFSKYLMAKICEGSRNIYDLCLFGVYGKYEEYQRRFISNAICRVLAGMDITIQKNVYFDYLWIDDLCKIMRWFLEHEPKHQRYHVCRGRKIDLYSLAELVKRTLRSDCRILVKETGWKPEYSGDNQRLLREMGGFSFTGFAESVAQLSDYYQSHWHLVDRAFCFEEKGP